MKIISLITDKYEYNSKTGWFMERAHQKIKRLDSGTLIKQKKSDNG